LLLLFIHIYTSIYLGPARNGDVENERTSVAQVGFGLTLHCSCSGRAPEYRYSTDSPQNKSNRDHHQKTLSPIQRVTENQPHYHTANAAKIPKNMGSKLVENPEGRRKKERKKKARPA